MKTNIISLTLFAFVAVYAQNEDALVLDKTDNQFPLDHLEPGDVLNEGSGEGVLDEPNIETTTASIILTDLETVDSTSLKNEAVDITSNSDELPCPKPCVCSVEGDTNNFITDCSGYDLKEFPSGIDPRTTTLNLHNNKLTEIPKDVSALKQLKTFNANNNQIMEIVAGSVSELPELVTLKLANNRLIEYPKDLQNSIILIKLEELDIGANDMRTTLNPETFSNFKALRKLTLPTTTTSQLVLDLCESLKETLETVCSESCTTASFECPDAPEAIDKIDGLLDATLPAVIAFNGETPEDNNDPKFDTSDEPQISNNVETQEQNGGLQSATDATLPGDIALNGGIAEDNNDQNFGTEDKNIETETSEEPKITNNPETTKQDIDSKSVTDPTLPEVIAFNGGIVGDNNDLNLGTEEKKIETESNDKPELINNPEISEPILPGVIAFNSGIAGETASSESPQTSNNLETTKQNSVLQSVTDFSLRSAVNKAPQEVSNTIVESSNDIHDDKKTTASNAPDSKVQDDVKVGAKTVDTKTGGIDKSVIGIIVAGMIVVVAGITIKKNWSSIKKRFSSTPRPNERTPRTTNGVTPEEVPLKDKSPV